MGDLFDHVSLQKAMKLIGVTVAALFRDPHTPGTFEGVLWR